MPEFNVRGEWSRRFRVCPSDNLKLARRNTAYFLLILCLQDVFWLVCSRVAQMYGPFSYQVVRWDWSAFVLFITIAFALTFICVASARYIKPLPKFHVRQGMLVAVLAVAVLLNLATFILLDPSLRYVSGGRTGISGLIYSFGLAFSIASMVAILRQNTTHEHLPRWWVYTFVLAFALTIDGLAKALMLGLFLFLYWKVTIRKPSTLLWILIIGIVLAWIGISAKWNDIPDYVTPGFLLHWAVARFSIQAEQMFRYVAGESMIYTDIGYWELIVRAISDRVEVLLGNSPQLEYPRTISEALSYDMRKRYGSGSSPGFLLGMTLLGPLFFVIPILYSFLFIQFFYGYLEKITFLQACAYSFIFKAIHANTSELFTLVSPTLVYITFFLAISLSVNKGKKTGYIGPARRHARFKYFRRHYVG